jgi:hypothetical protein
VADASPDPTSPDTRCHFFRLSLELRDDIYDYVAYGQRSQGLHVNLETATEPKVHAYDRGLSQTSSQVRQEYTLRLKRHIMHLDISHPASLWAASRGTMLGRPILQQITSQSVLIAERKESRGMWVQDDVALRSSIFFNCSSGHGGWLTFTVASSDMRVYNRRFNMRAISFEKDKGCDWNLVFALKSLSLLEGVAQFDTRNWWMCLWGYLVRHDLAFYPSITKGLDVECFCCG